LIYNDGGLTVAGCPDKNLKSKQHILFIGDIMGEEEIKREDILNVIRKLMDHYTGISLLSRDVYRIVGWTKPYIDLREALKMLEYAIDGLFEFEEQFIETEEALEEEKKIKRGKI
jgi:hypothetical protein